MIPGWKVRAMRKGKVGEHVSARAEADELYLHGLELRKPHLQKRRRWMGRQIGAPLWPERFDLTELANIEATVGPYYWQAEYQQRPAMPEGWLYFDKTALDYGLAHA